MRSKLVTLVLRSLLLSTLAACGDEDVREDLDIVYEGTRNGDIGNGTPIRAEGPAQEDERSVGPFSRVDSSGSFDVHIRQADTFALKVVIEPVLLPYVKTIVDGETLAIFYDGPSYTSRTRGQVLVTLPHLRALSRSGSGDVDLATEEPDSLSLSSAGSGTISFVGSAPALTVGSAGSGRVRLSGTSERLDIDVTGSGRVDAKALTASSGRISISGSGHVAATLARTADVSIVGSGKVDLFGGAKVERKSIHGSGDLNIH